MRLWIVAALAIALAGCATAPAPRPVQDTRTYGQPYDEVWENLMAFMTSQNLRLTTVGKASGVAYVEALDFTDQQGDCGASPLALSVARKAHINVYVRPVDSQRTRVTVNTRLTAERRFGVLPPTIVECVSTGVIENMILDAL